MKNNLCFFCVCVIIILASLQYKYKSIENTFNYFKSETQKFVAENNTEKEFNLKSFEVQNDENSKSSVYKLKVGEKNFLLSADKEIKKLVGENYELTQLHKNEFWDPNTCAKVPVMIDGNKAYFMEQVRMAGDDGVLKNTQTVSVFDIEKNRHIRYDIKGIQNTGYIYNDDMYGVYIVSPMSVGVGKKISAVSIYALDEVNKKLVLKDIIKDDVLDNSAVFKSHKDKFTVAYSDKKFSWLNAVLENGKLIKINNSEIDNGVRVVNDFAYKKVYNSEIISAQSFMDFDDLRLIQENKEILKIGNDKVNKYIIGEIK